MKYVFLSLMAIMSFSCKAQTAVKPQPILQTKNVIDRPKLAVGIVVDQMRYDYLVRFYDRYGEGGFKRLMGEGFNFKNHHFNYIPTYTAPGHASVFTGTTPKYHGIISNNWYDKELKKGVYCAFDDSIQPVGTTSDAGKMSPHRMMTTTFADENRLFTQKKGKTIGISLKDRAAIMPAGHMANAAYWFNGENEGRFISSSFYLNELPKWVQDFNKSGKVDSYLKTWDTFFDIETYTESGSDLNDFEGGFKGKETATFPYDLVKLKEFNGNYDILKSTPYGNSIVADFAIAALKGEQLGKDDITDVFTVSFSSTDYIGHNFGVNSKEIEDVYIRLDRDLERLLNALDKEVGKGNYIVFLTADHAAVHVPAYLESNKIPSGYANTKEQKDQFGKFMETTYGSADLVENVSNNQIFLNHGKLKELGLKLEEVEQAIVDEIITYDNIYKAYTAVSMNTSSNNSGIEKMLENGYNQKRSGDVLFIFKPSVISYSRTGSTHGSGFSYDTHVPLLFMGKGIKHGSTYKHTEITDVAPTVCALLGISFPSGTYGSPLDFILKEE